MKDGHPTENHHKLGQFEHFQRLKEFVQERYTKSQGFGAKGFKAKGVLH